MGVVLRAATIDDVPLLEKWDEAVLTPNEMMRTDTQSRPVITLTSGTIPLSTTFATQMRLHMIALTRITN